MKKVILWVLGIILASVIGFGGYSYYKLSNTTSKIYSGTQHTSKISDTKTKKGQSIAYLLLGTDTGALGRTEKGRTDTMIVMVLNPDTNTTTMVSLQRDTKIQIDGQTEKLNAAYQYGDAQSSVDQVEKLLNIKLDGYLLVNMNGLEQLVNAVGGVDVTAPLTFNYEGYAFTQGQNYHMDGQKALAFSRMRYDDPNGDYGRQIRQQLVISAVINKLKNNPTNVLSDNFLQAVSQNVRTNISLNSVRNLATKYKGSADNIERDQMKGEGVMIGSVSYQIMPESEISRVHTIIEQARNN